MPNWSDAPFAYRSSDPWATCERSGWKVRQSDLVVEWTGLRVLARLAEPKHPSLDVPPMRGEEVVSDPTGQPVNVFVDIPVVDYGE